MSDTAFMIALTFAALIAFFVFAVLWFRAVAERIDDDCGDLDFGDPDETEETRARK